ncbi:MAG: (d)CMP kinase [Clostridium sp.]
MVSVAIDGPAGAGKSTIARQAAKTMGYIYVDTGALYRAIGLFALKNGVDLCQQNQVEQMLSNVQIELVFLEGEQHVFLCGTDVSQEIRTPEVSMAASQVSAILAVRDFLFDLQRDMAKKHSVIMDGRDIGTVVLPHAQVKIFLTASPEERARRRFEELKQKGSQSSYEEVLKDLKQRDYQDSHREIAPLRPAEDAIEVDTTGLSLQQSVDRIIMLIKERLS